MRSATPPHYLNRLAILLTTVCTLALTASATRAATLFYVRGGGDGHGIGMSQYGAEGYALHGEDDRFILAHYYQGTAIGQTSPTRTVRVLISDGTASFTGATAAGRTTLSPATTYTVATAGSSSATPRAGPWRPSCLRSR